MKAVKGQRGWGSGMKKIKRVGVVTVLLMLLIAAGCMALQGCSSSKSSASTASASAATVSVSSASASAASNEKSAQASNEVVVPDLIGKNLGDVKDEIKDFDVDYVKADGSKANVMVKSNWRVDEQSIEPGTTVSKKSKLTLKLGHLTEEKAAEEKAAKEAKVAEERASIDYIPVSAGELLDELEVNAMNAKEKYKGGYYRVTGVVSNIDASGRYIDLDPEGVMYNFKPISCSINDDSVRDRVRQISTGDTVTVAGQITDVGEFLGYRMDAYIID